MNLKRRIRRLEKLIIPELAANVEVVLIVSYIAAKDGQPDRTPEDYPDCPGYEEQLSAAVTARQPGNSNIVLVYCHANCTRKCLPEEDGAGK